MKRTFERTEPKAQLTFYNKQMLIRHHSLLRNSMSPTDKLPCYWHIIMVSRAYFGGLFSQDTLKLGIDRYGFSMNTHPSKILHCCFYGHLDFLYRYCDFGFIILKLLQPINVEIKYEYKWELATKVAGILCEKESLKKIKVNMCLYREEDVDQHIEFVNQLPDKIVEFTGDVYHIDTLESRQCQLEALNIELNDWSFDVDDSHGEITQESILARIVCLNAKCINLEAFGFDVLGLIDDVRENVNLETLKFHIKLYDWCSYIEKQQPDDYNDNDPNWKNVYDQKCRKALQNVKQLCGNRPILILTDETTTITQIQVNTN
ncbi:hypothetical protein M3Y94_00412400 [Aphelenchoides besseyi]|nr:hypothetical protein M3Y94_00412400 [Aphelenchoides besseyi]